MNIPNDDISGWLSELKPYQRSTLLIFLDSSDPEQAAEKWLTTIGSPNIAQFGGQPGQDPKPFFEKFKAECHRFICDDNAYIENKKEILDASPVSKQLLISVMSSAIGAHLGAAGTLLAPAVTLILFTVGQLGLNAYCAK